MHFMDDRFVLYHLVCEQNTAGWALCDRPSSVDASLTHSEEDFVIPESEGHFWRFFPKPFRLRIGMQCKRLIDACRQQDLDALPHLKADLTRFVPEDISPENTMIRAITFASFD